MLDEFDFDPPDDDLVQALVTAQGPVFDMLDSRLAQILENRKAPAPAPVE
jgi:hypothetical protein